MKKAFCWGLVTSILLMLLCFAYFKFFVIREPAGWSSPAVCEFHIYWKGWTKCVSDSGGLSALQNLPEYKKFNLSACDEILSKAHDEILEIDNAMERISECKAFSHKEKLKRIEPLEKRMTAIASKAIEEVHREFVKHEKEKLEAEEQKEKVK